MIEKVLNLNNSRQAVKDMKAHIKITYYEGNEKQQMQQNSKCFERPLLVKVIMLGCPMNTTFHKKYKS